MKKKIFGVSAALFSFPLVAFAGMGMFAEKCGGYGYGMHHSMFWLFMLAVITFAIWAIVGVLAAIWLWEHIGRGHTRRSHNEE